MKKTRQKVSLRMMKLKVRETNMMQEMLKGKREEKRLRWKTEWTLHFWVKTIDCQENTHQLEYIWRLGEKGKSNR